MEEEFEEEISENEMCICWIYQKNHTIYIGYPAVIAMNVSSEDIVVDQQGLPIIEARLV